MFFLVEGADTLLEVLLIGVPFSKVRSRESLRLMVAVAIVVDVMGGSHFPFVLTNPSFAVVVAVVVAVALARDEDRHGQDQEGREGGDQKCWEGSPQEGSAR